MTPDAKMQMDLLVYKIVSLRIIFGNYDNSATTRKILEVQTRTRIRRLTELENTNEHEEVKSRSASSSITVRAPKSTAAMPAF